MKALNVFFVFCLWPLGGGANTNPVPVVVSAVMRSNSTLMDVVYRVNDPDDSTVKVRALAFIDGSRSFTSILRPSVFVEGTGTNLGDAIPANTNHTLTWDVAADWDIDLGQAKFEILCLDNRGLLGFDWISIPATNGQPALTISQNTPVANKVLDALFWLYASGDSGVSLTGGVLRATPASGVFGGVGLANGSVPQGYAVPYLLRRMDLDPASSAELAYAQTTARAGLSNAASWHAVNRPYGGMACVVGWGGNSYGQCDFTTGGAIEVTAITSGSGASHGLALGTNGAVFGWGNNSWGQATIPAGLTGVTAIAAGDAHSLAVRGDGTVFAWGWNAYGQTNVPSGLSNVIAVAAGWGHSLALRSNGTVVGWGNDGNHQIDVPANVSNVTAIGAGWGHSLALKSDGTVAAWGASDAGKTNLLSGLSNVTAIAAGAYHNMALRGDGTVIAWGANDCGQTNVPPGLGGVTAIAAGGQHSVALASNGTIVAWGWNNFGQTNIPSGLVGVTAIAAGWVHGSALKPKAP